MTSFWRNDDAIIASHVRWDVVAANKDGPTQSVLHDLQQA